MVEKFSIAELSALRNELMQNGLDSWQAAELFHVFLSGRGYGVSSGAAIDAAARVEESGCSIDISANARMASTAAWQDSRVTARFTCT